MKTKSFLFALISLLSMNFAQGYRADYVCSVDMSQTKPRIEASLKGQSQEYIEQQVSRVESIMLWLSYDAYTAKLEQKDKGITAFKKSGWTQTGDYSYTVVFGDKNASELFVYSRGLGFYATVNIDNNLPQPLSLRFTCAEETQPTNR